MAKKQQMTVEEWLQLGRDNGWCGTPFCWTHNDIPMTEEELDNWEEDDKCLYTVRLYESPETLALAEPNG